MAYALEAIGPLDGLRKRTLAWAESGRRLVRAEPRASVAVGLGTIALAVISAVQLVAVEPPVSAAPPAPPPLLVKPVAPDQARVINASLPLEDTENPAASPFRFTGSKDARAQAAQCLADAVYYEAGNQDVNGARAVAQVVLNRVRHPAFPASVCGVVYQGSARDTGCQFSFTCDGSLARKPDAAGWRRAQAVAEAALVGSVYSPVGWATHYHADYVVPYWAASLAKNAVVGAHLFYHWAGGWGRPRAFGQRYRGAEANVAALRETALAAEGLGSSDATTERAAEIAELEGVETVELTPSMRGDKRVALRFNQVAREASEKAVHEDYVERVEATDNLKFALSGDTVSKTQAPLGSTTAN